MYFEELSKSSRIGIVLEDVVVFTVFVFLEPGCVLLGLLMFLLLSFNRSYFFLRVFLDLEDRSDGVDQTLLRILAFVHVRHQFHELNLMVNGSSP